MVRVGLIGCGTIGSRVALTLARKYRSVARIVALHDADPSRARSLARRLPSHPPVVALSALLRRSQLVLEAASVDAAAKVVGPALRAHRSIFVMSVGGLLINRTWQGLLRASRGRVYIPSGALAGLDGMKAMALGRITRATLTSRKPPRALASAPYLQRRGVRLAGVKRPTVVFHGSPEAVVKAFPQNTNVAAALTLAVSHGKAAARRPSIRIRVVADPTITRNIHEVEILGDCGRLWTRVESRPSRNPKTSELAVRSAIATLERIFGSAQIGT
ncbi:MAG: aspartate dehydrogenase [Candidatus Omnitrophica bacterium CG11_big_fil_rev_8_21_14_0_20_63_9]|nr:MAG: aspartate dehydrogenase [Candidatus Omnitrophica bacterium CG11_big_fil_rev_8_21_14_0_20_63_9]